MLIWVMSSERISPDVRGSPNIERIPDWGTLELAKEGPVAGVSRNVGEREGDASASRICGPLTEESSIDVS